MKSLYTEDGARRAIEQYGAKHGEDVALRVYTSRLIGSEADLVLHGGGNTSVKGELTTIVGDRVACLWVKGSGSSLDRVEPKDFPALDLAYLRRLRSLGALSDEEMVNQLRTHLFDASSPNPSVEALLHAFLPHKFVDHSHADAVLAVTNQANGAVLVREALGDRVAVLPYIMPGFPLAKAVAEVYEASPNVVGVVLLHHGLFTFGATARESYERHIELVDAFESFANKRATRGASVAVDVGAERSARARLSAIAPVVRGLVADARSGDAGYRRLVMEWRCNDEILSFCAARHASELAQTGPITPDHVIRTKAWPAFASELPADDAVAREQLTETVASFRVKYDSYFETNLREKRVQRTKLDSAPRVVLVPGVGILAWGATKKDARIAADITEHTLRTKATADAMGGYVALSDADLFDMEYWSLEQAKLGKAAPRALEGQVVLVTGGAGAIGRGIAHACAKEGAHVVIVDRDPEGARAAAAEVERAHGAGTALAVDADVTSEASMRAAFDAACVAYGGVDVVVPNAGIALVRPIEELSNADALRVAEVNYIGVLTTLREATRVFRAQGTGGNVVVNASKNVFAPGKDFGAYSASKAAAHQLAKVAALELAPLGVRVNQINADAVFSYGETKSGLWEEVGPARAKSRGLSMTELEAYYRDRNLLRARVDASHVGNAVVFFATEKTPTTGATLPVDGGIPEAFPR
ncbi:MAG: bifunctional aldolase/short-chain dehydrogenase [Polyangiaceae bacterium]|nr:bifunctional aldolase/short-chain dehydrogenase [Polyangiaceae bacterium]